MEAGNSEPYAPCTVPAAPPLVAGATTFAPVGSVSLDSQSPKGSLRIQFPCHPASRWDYGCWAFRATGAYGSSGGDFSGAMHCGTYGEIAAVRFYSAP